VERASQCEYLAAFETNQSTPYYLNLHYQDIPHTLMLGMTGTGESFTCNFLLTHAQKYAPRTVIFDLGDSYRMLTQFFGSSYMQLGIDRNAFSINPFSLPTSEENLHFLFSASPKNRLLRVNFLQTAAGTPYRLANWYTALLPILNFSLN
jgi:type IV secretory pathway VirB4 component